MGEKIFIFTFFWLFTQPGVLRVSEVTEGNFSEGAKHRSLLSAVKWPSQRRGKNLRSKSAECQTPLWCLYSVSYW